MQSSTSTRKIKAGDFPWPKNRKYAILFAATLLCARKLMELDSDRPSPAKIAAAENAITQAAFIIEHIEKRWPKE